MFIRMGHYKIIYIFDKIDNIDIIESEPIPEINLHSIWWVSKTKELFHFLINNE